MSGIHDKPRAISIDHEVMRLLQSVGLAEQVERMTCHHTGTEFRGLDDRLIKVFHPVPPPYLLGWPPNLMFVQPELEAALRDGVARFPNVAVYLGTEALQVEQSADSVGLTVKDSGGRQRSVRGRYMVACDGAASSTRKWLGISQESQEFDEWWTVVDAWLEESAEAPECTTQFCRPSGPATYVVGPRGLRRWELKLMPGESPGDYEDIARVRRRLSALVDPDTIDIWRVATYRFHALIADAWRCERVFLAGDAAHQMPPFMAQGLCSGMRDAGNLGWKLTAVLRDGLSARLLDSYAEERKPHIRQLTATTKELGLIIGELDEARARQRDEVLARALESGASETVRQKFIPDLVGGMLAMAANGRCPYPAGALAPQPRVRLQGRDPVLLDDVAGGGFLILTLGAAARGWIDRASTIIWERLHGRILAIAESTAAAPVTAGVLTEDGTMFRDWMEAGGCRAVVIRPDNIVFGGASDAETLNRLITQVGRHIWPAVEIAGAA